MDNIRGSFFIMDYNIEIWKDVVGYEGLYKVSSFGNVLSVKRGIYLNKKSKRSGHLYIGLSKNNVRKNKYVHRLVAIAFIPNPENKPEVNHINGNPKDNNLYNLEWNTRYENSIHSYKILDRHKKATKVAVYDIDMNLIKVYKSQMDASIELNIHKSSIFFAVKRGSLLHKKYFVKYA